MSIAPKSRVRRTTKYKVVWHVRMTRFIDSMSRTDRDHFKCEFAVVRTPDAAIRKMLKFGMPLVRPGDGPPDFVREKHCGTAKTKPAFYWRSLDKRTTISATPYRVE